MISYPASYRIGVDVGGTYMNTRSATCRLIHPNLL